MSGDDLQWWDLIGEVQFCKHCGLELEHKMWPDMGGNHKEWWVHVPGGYQICFPQRPEESPRAEPMGLDD